MQRKGIVLAGGTGTRLHPSTIAVSKQLMPVFDKPMIYYPLSVLMRAGIRDILIITTPHEQLAFKTLLGDGSEWGINIKWEVQPTPDGIAQALIIGESFLNGAPCALVLGDNLFFGEHFNKVLDDAVSRKEGALVFGYWVKNPEAYGVVGFDKDMKAMSMIEKPKNPESNYAVTGLYLYDGKASEYARRVTPSARGELEITTVNQMYLESDSLYVEILGEGTTWLDTGTHRSLLQASQFVSVIEERQGRRICCPEEIAFKNGWIDVAKFRSLGERLKNSGYGDYLLRVAEQDEKT